MAIIVNQSFLAPEAHHDHHALRTKDGLMREELQWLPLLKKC